MDALKIRNAIFAGFDWGRARRPSWPCSGRNAVKRLSLWAAISSAASQPTRHRTCPRRRSRFGISIIFATEIGQAGYRKYLHDFAKLIWQTASPKWNFDDATFERSAASLNNPDHVAITIHNYRWRIGLADGERKYDDLEKRLAALRAVAVPTITMEGDANGAIHAPNTAYRDKFSGKYEYRLITGGVGHNLPQEAPQAFAQAVIDVDGYSKG